MSNLPTYNKFLIANSLDFCESNLQGVNEVIEVMLKDGIFFENGDLEKSEEKLKEIIKLAKALNERLGKFKEVKIKINEI